MQIYVCVKHVPDTAATIKIEGDAGFAAAGVKFIINPYDEYAIEEAVRISEKAGGQAYQDDPQSPILLLGDSFSKVFQTDAPYSAGLIANLAYELQMPLASIVNDGGASTLVRQQLARRLDLLKNKRLVIWEFVERDIRFGLRGWQPVALTP